MMRMLNSFLLIVVLALTACSDLGNKEVEKILTDAKVYPLNVEYKMFCNDGKDVQMVIDKKLVEDGFVTAQLRHTKDDVGKPLIYFTEKATPYLIPTNDTLKSFDIQRIKMAEEVLLQVRNVEINPAGDKAVVDYTTSIINPTPFVILSNENLKGEQKRRTFLSKKNNEWKWDGRIIKI